MATGSLWEVSVLLKHRGHCKSLLKCLTAEVRTTPNTRTLYDWMSSRVPVPALHHPQSSLKAAGMKLQMWARHERS